MTIEILRRSNDQLSTGIKSFLEKLQTLIQPTQTLSVFRVGRRSDVIDGLASG